MNIRNFFALALLVVALFLAFMPWKPSTSSTSSVQNLQSPSSPTPPQQSAEMQELSAPHDWWALIIAHRKMAGFLIVCVMVVVGIGMARRFFDKI